MKKSYPLEKPAQCYFCHPEEGIGYMKRVYHYDVQCFGTWGNFFVLPMIGAGIDGYLLISHKDHYHSMADIPPEDIKSLRELIDIIKKEITKNYAPSVVFEHGSTCDNVSCLIDHAHIHITPVPEGFDIKKEIEQDFELSTVRKYTDLNLWCHGGLGRLQYQINDKEIDEKTAHEKFQPFLGYLYYENTHGQMFIHELEDLYCFQPQYIRMVMFKKLGKETWQWNKNIDPETQKRTLEKLQQGLSKYLTPFNIDGGIK